MEKAPVYPRPRPPERAVVEETVVVRKEVPVEEYDYQVRKSHREAGIVDQAAYGTTSYVRRSAS